MAKNSKFRFYDMDGEVEKVVLTWAEAIAYGPHRFAEYWFTKDGSHSILWTYFGDGRWVNGTTGAARIEGVQ